MGRGFKGLRRSPVICVLGAAFIVWWCAAIFVFVVDPLELYPWGMRPRLASADYGPAAGPYLVDVAAKDRQVDAYVVGGSMTIPFTREMLNRAWNVRNAFNISYNGPRPGDRGLAAQSVLEHAHPRRVLVSFDWFYQDRIRVEGVFPSYLYDGPLWNDLRQVGMTTLVLAAETLTARPLWRERWDLAREMNARAATYREFQKPEAQRKLSELVATYRSRVDTPGSYRCEDFEALEKQLIPFARALSERGVPLDILVPPYSLAMYYQRQFDVSSSFLRDQLQLRRCMVMALDGLPGVRIFSFDNDARITGDMRNYLDGAHPFGQHLYEYMLRSMMEDRRRLTKANLEGELDLLHRRVVNFEPSRSKKP